jgi:hypothetical protein
MRKGIHVLILALALAATGLAQTTTGTVTGRVIDSSGASVPQATITLINTGTQLKLPTQTDADGNYSFVAVQPAAYRLEAENTGFQKFATQFNLAVDQTVRVDVTLTIGQMTNTVEVNDKAALVESETSSLGQVISSKQVSDLPLNGRNPFALASLTPGVVPLGSFGVGLNATRSAAQMAGANNFMANGGIAGSNEVLLDGAPITVCCQGQPAIIPSVDVTREFKVQTNASSAEFGRTSGGILNIITKSGTNDLHGSAYEFLGNDQFNAANFFTNRAGKAPIPGRNDFRTPLRYNQYGFSAGGPVIIPKLYNGKDKTFFFGGFEGTKVRQYGYVTSVVPPVSLRGGNFAGAPFGVYDPQTTKPDPANPGQYIRTAFPNNQIPASRLNPIALKYLNLFPADIRNSFSDNYDFIQRLTSDDKQGNIRVDHNFSESDRLFARWSTSDDGYVSGDWVNGISGYKQSIGAKTFVLDNVRVLNPGMVLDVRYGLAIQHNIYLADAVGTDPTSVGFSPSYAAAQLVKAIPALNIGGYRSIGGDTLRNWSRYSHALSATTTWVHSAHTIKFGWDGRLYRDNESTLDGGAGSFSYDSTYTTGPNPRAGVPAAQGPYDSLAALLLGIPSSGAITYNDSWARQQYYHAFFLQDDWRLTSKLTLNLGLRLDIETGFTERFNRQAGFDPNAASPLAQAAGLPLKGAAVFSGVNGAPRSLWKTDWNNVAPRIGFAYKLTPKTVMRGGYGIFYLPTSQRGYGSSNPGFQVSTPYVASIDGVTPVGTISNPFPLGTLPLVGAANGASTLVGASISGLYYDTPMPYVQQWNFGVERELPSRVLLNVSYAGSHSVKLPLNFSANTISPSLFGAPGDQARVAYLTATVPNPFYKLIPSGQLAAATIQRQVLLRAFPQFTSVSEQYLGQANASYDALLVSLQKSYTRGLTMIVSYAFSKNIGDANNLTTGFLDVGTPGYQNDYNRKIERSVVATDIPQRLVVSANYELPFGKGRAFGSNMHPVLNALLGGWQLNGIVTAQSGFPLQFTASGAPSFGGSRPSYTSADPQVFTSGSIEDRLGGISGGSGYLNSSAFRVPVSFELGNVPRLTPQFRMPAKMNLDISVMKSFRIRERLSAQLRAEAFNALNQVVFNGPNTAVGSAAFGTITSQSNSPRNLQLALKILW